MSDGRERRVEVDMQDLDDFAAGLRKAFEAGTFTVLIDTDQMTPAQDARNALCPGCGGPGPHEVVAFGQRVACMCGDSWSRRQR